MDESSTDFDQVFRDAAQHAAAFAYVLDPSKAIERGIQLRRFARRRRAALSGLVASAVVIVFLVPLPQLHLFGSDKAHTSTKSTTTTSPVTATGPPGGVIPADFLPRSFTAVNLDQWWMLGTARCPTRSGRCSAIVRTVDGGSKFAGIPGPPVSVTDVTQLRFANTLDGYAFGPKLWETANGGTSWTEVSTPGPVTELELGDGEAYALTCPDGSANCHSMALVRSRVGLQRWQRVSTPVTLSYGAQLAVSGRNLYVLSGSEEPGVLLYSANSATTFTKRANPCARTLGGSVTAAADGSPTLWAACTSGSEAAAWLSNNGGTSWVEEQGGFPNSLQLAAASASVVLAWPGTETATVPFALDRSTNGGKSYSVVLPVSSSSTVSWAEFSTPARAYALVAGGHTAHLFQSNDGGVSWRLVAITK